MQNMIIDDNVSSGPSRPSARQASSTWKQWLSTTRIFLTRERKLPLMPVRSITMAVAWLAFSVMVFGELTPSPRFTLSKSGDHIVSRQYDPLRKASDWLSGRKYAVLTFDDGPDGNGVDEKILSVLRHHHAHAMFFVICNRIDDDTAAIVARFESEGHLIGNHSFEHPMLSREPSSKLAHQIEGCSREIAKVTGHRPRYFRPPFGMTSSSVAMSARGSGMQQVLWSVNSYDDVSKHPNEIIRQASDHADDASIILMHQNVATASALDQILVNLEQHGFTFVLPENDSKRDTAT